MKNLWIFMFIMVWTVQFIKAQVKGKITDGNGESLAFAAIYVKGTTKGTSSNIEGHYELSLNEGKSTLVFQYLGFKVREELIDYKGGIFNLDVELEPSVYSLKEITISSTQEDPA